MGGRNQHGEFFGGSCFPLAEQNTFSLHVQTKTLIRCQHVTHDALSRVVLRLRILFIPSLVPFRAMCHDLHRAPSMLPSLSLSPPSPSFTRPGSRLITSRISCADSRDFRVDGFTDPELFTHFAKTNLTLIVFAKQCQ